MLSRFCEASPAWNWRPFARTAQGDKTKFLGSGAKGLAFGYEMLRRLLLEPTALSMTSESLGIIRLFGYGLMFVLKPVLVVTLVVAFTPFFSESVTCVSTLVVVFACTSAFGPACNCPPALP